MKMIEELQDQVGKLSDKLSHGVKTLITQEDEVYKSLKGELVALNARFDQLFAAAGEMADDEKESLARYASTIESLSATVARLTDAINTRASAAQFEALDKGMDEFADEVTNCFERIIKQQDLYVKDFAAWRVISDNRIDRFNDLHCYVAEIKRSQFALKKAAVWLMVFVTSFFFANIVILWGVK